MPAVRLAATAERHGLEVGYDSRGRTHALSGIAGMPLCKTTKQMRPGTGRTVCFDCEAVLAVRPSASANS